jgi:hypothetical protein
LIPEIKKRPRRIAIIKIPPINRKLHNFSISKYFIEE